MKTFEIIGLHDREQLIEINGGGFSAEEVVAICLIILFTALAVCLFFF